MLYLMSDIHGDLKAFQKMLKKIHFDIHSDQLIIIGDIVDRDPGGMEIIKMLKPWIEKKIATVCMGNHEMFMSMWLRGKLPDYKWMAFGGEETLKIVKNYSFEQKKELLDFLEGLPIYIERDLPKFGRTVITHAGIHCDHYIYNDDGTINVVRSIEKAMEVHLYSFLICDDLHYIPSSDLKKLDRYLIVGHKPTFRINEDYSCKVIQTPYYMDIDSGSGYRKDGGRLSCYCAETGEIFYV